MSGGKAEAMEKVYYVDYKGMIDPGRTAREHVGVVAIPVKNRILLLRPGLQRIAAALWESVREHGQIGYDQASKSYKGELVKRGTIRVYEPKDGKMDWSSVVGGLDDLASRTTIVDLLDDMLAHVEKQGGLEFLAARLREHRKACATDFDGKPVPAERLQPMSEVA